MSEKNEKVEAMSEQAGSSVAAIQVKQAGLVRQHSTIADADQALMEVLISAHAGWRESVGRLDIIAEEIERAAEDRTEFGAANPMGAREFRKFLIAKKREIAVIVADAQELDHRKSVVLDNLRAQYASLVR